MAETTAEPGAGDVPFTLGGKELVLKPSLEACMAISKLAGNSLALAVQRCDRLDFEFICEVIAYGINETSPHLRKQIQEAVFRSGVISVAADCILFIRAIMNGGVLPKQDEEAGDEAEAPLAESESQSESITAV